MHSKGALKLKCKADNSAAFPHTCAPSDLKSVRNRLCLLALSLQVFEFLIRLHSAEGSVDEEVYPYVRTLLHFDTREFLNVLALVRDPGFLTAKCSATSPIISEVCVNKTLL